MYSFYSAFWEFTWFLACDLSKYSTNVNNCKAAEFCPIVMKVKLLAIFSKQISWKCATLQFGERQGYPWIYVTNWIVRFSVSQLFLFVDKEVYLLFISKYSDERPVQCKQTYMLLNVASMIAIFWKKSLWKIAIYFK